MPVITGEAGTDRCWVTRGWDMLQSRSCQHFADRYNFRVSSAPMFVLLVSRQQSASHEHVLGG